MQQTMSASIPATGGYILGHSAHEQRRLDEQGVILRPYTERLLRDAGLGSGMRVLDVGCGTGDVTRIAAELVGSTGSVIGVDRAPEVLARARDCVAALGLRHVRFVEANVGTVTLPELSTEPFDAVVGRLVLAYQPDPIAVVRHLAGLVRPGGVLAFADLVLYPPQPWQRRPVLGRCAGWAMQTFERAGVKTDMGLRLHATFVDAGLPAPDMRLDGVVFAGADAAKFRWFVDTIRTLVPAMERLGVATAAEVDIETLLDRLLREANAVGGAVCGFMLGGAWIRKPPEWSM